MQRPRRLRVEVDGMASQNRRGPGGRPTPPAKSRQARKPAPAASEETSDPVLPAVNPVVDDHVSPNESPPFPIVAIGASAGGLEAISGLLGTLPTDTGMA